MFSLSSACSFSSFCSHHPLHWIATQKVGVSCAAQHEMSFLLLSVVTHIAERHHCDKLIALRKKKKCLDLFRVMPANPEVKGHCPTDRPSSVTGSHEPCHLPLCWVLGVGCWSHEPNKATMIAAETRASHRSKRFVAHQLCRRYYRTAVRRSVSVQRCPLLCIYNCLVC